MILEALFALQLATTEPETNCIAVGEAITKLDDVLQKAGRAPAEVIKIEGEAMNAYLEATGLEAPEGTEYVIIIIMPGADNVIVAAVDSNGVSCASAGIPKLVHDHVMKDA